MFEIKYKRSATHYQYVIIVCKFTIFLVSNRAPQEYHNFVLYKKSLRMSSNIYIDNNVNTAINHVICPL